jgi:hypothetical protein
MGRIREPEDTVHKFYKCPNVDDFKPITGVKSNPRLEVEVKVGLDCSCVVKPRRPGKRSTDANLIGIARALNVVLVIFKVIHYIPVYYVRTQDCCSLDGRAKHQYQLRKFPLVSHIALPQLPPQRCLHRRSSIEA